MSERRLSHMSSPSATDLDPQFGNRSPAPASPLTSHEPSSDISPHIPIYGQHRGGSSSILHSPLQFQEVRRSSRLMSKLSSTHTIRPWPRLPALLTSPTTRRFYSMNRSPRGATESVSRRSHPLMGAMKSLSHRSRPTGVHARTDDIGQMTFQTVVCFHHHKF